LALPSTAFYDGGDRFSVVVSNAAGQATSPEVALTVNIRPKLAMCSAAYVARADGSLWSWGSNESLGLGRGSDDPALQPTPQAVPSLTNVVNVACGLEHVLVLLRDGSVRSWGRNTNGQLGDGTRLQRNAPAMVTGLSDVVSIAAGRYSSYALKRDGTLWRWGSLAAPVIPSPVDPAALLAPQQVAAPEPIAGVAVGYEFADTVLLVARSGQLHYLGLDLRDSLLGTLSTAVAPIAGLSDITSASVGGGFALAIRPSGSVVMWGSGSSGALGNGASGALGGYVSQPTAVPTVPATAAIHAGSSLVIARSAGSRLFSWGTASYGALGRVDPGRETRPGEIDLPEAESVAVGLVTPSALAMTRDGRVWAWGYNFHGVLGVLPSQALSSDFPVLVNGITGR
jgi:alpha-tubulin suppressor-like RCC1 family protein